MAQHSDDSEMSRFDRDGLRRGSAREAVLAVAIVALILIAFAGGAVLRAGEEMTPGIGRDVLTTVGEPTGWAARSLPFEGANARLTAALSPDEELLAGGGFESLEAGVGSGAGGAPQPIGPGYFDPVELGEPVPRRPLESVLVTGDSLSQPLDAELARRLVGDGVEVHREPRPGTGISNDALVDWGRLAATLAARDEPQAVVVFIGANEGYPLPGPGGGQVQCCGPRWAAGFAIRVRQMMGSFRRAGAAKVYWLLVPTARDPARKPITHAVNAAIEVAAQPWRDQVRLVDLVSTFTPGERYRDAIEIDGEERIVRESDGIHLNEAGAVLAAETVLERIELDFER